MTTKAATVSTKSRWSVKAYISKWKSEDQQETLVRRSKVEKEEEAAKR